jgi:hypothetical protein
MSEKNFYFIQEGLFVSKKIKDLFHLDGRDLSGNDFSRCNFTGLVIKGKDVLIAWPKNFFAPENIESSLDVDPKLLFDILVKYMGVTEKSYLNDTTKDLLSESYPLRAFYNVLSYYKKYGLYREEILIETQGYSGKYDWKKTVVKSNKVISEGKLLYMPFHIKKKYIENVFISECMAYVINETFGLLSFILRNRVHVDIEYNKELFLNRDFVLLKLKSLKGKIFKDINKKLVSDLITFFEELGNPSEFKYKNYYFSSIWETMIGEFLNRNLAYIDNYQHQLDSNCRVFDFKKQKFPIGNREIEIDHYFETENHIYIIDSKYYQSIQDLNYKQVSYDYFLRKETKTIINVLVAPFYVDKVKNHISYEKDQLLISEHYFIVQDVMRDCASN